MTSFSESSGNGKLGEEDPAISCHLYRLDPVKRISNELRELTGEEIEGGSALNPVELNKIDSMHYLGSEGTLKMLEQLGPTPPSALLDMGSGFGGCARFVAHTLGPAAHVTALELQPHLSAAASKLTARCGLANRIAHVTGDMLDYPALALPRAGHYDAAFSKLVVLHIPMDARAALWRNLAAAVRPGGFLYLEDYYEARPLGERERRVLEDKVGCAPLPSKEAYVAQLEACGFTDVAFTDVTPAWSAFVAQRTEAYRSRADRNNRVQGPEITAAMQEFYDVTFELFKGGGLGGGVVTARVGNR